ncbi:MAG: restriction endonuclease subunit S [Longimonas sp.]|uniref:restriction endonuclease subunit S n=1 Tax=Longimonas sp. TaxID=2039626 RepID=UPI003353814C
MDTAPLFDQPLAPSTPEAPSSDTETAPRPGFKKTKVGWIPEAWEVVRLEDVCRSISSGATPKRGNEKYFSDGEIPWIKTLDLTDSAVRTSKEKITQLAVEENSCDVLPLDTVLVAMYGGFNQIGRTGILEIEAATNQAICSLQIDTDRALPRYILEWLNHRVRYWRRYAASSRKDPNIKQADVRAFPTATPPRPEQRRIAGVLSTWDRALQQIDDLIAAKERRKKALMQQLLTGQTRLPKYKDQKRSRYIFKDAFRRLSSRGYQIKKSEYQETGKYPVVDQGQNRIVGYTDQENKVLKKHPLIVFGDHTRTVKWVDFPFVVGADGTQLLKTKEPCDLRYGLYLLQNTRLPNMGYSRHFKWLKEKHFYLPPLAEQHAIANILSTCDAELELLRTEREALQKQKKGMMQKLLTGAVRVPADHPVESTPNPTA